MSPTTDTTYFGRVISTHDNCVKDSDPVTVTAVNITASIDAPVQTDCSGTLTFTANPSGCDSCVVTTEC